MVSRTHPENLGHFRGFLAQNGPKIRVFWHFLAEKWPTEFFFGVSSAAALTILLLWCWYTTYSIFSQNNSIFAKTGKIYDFQILPKSKQKTAKIRILMIFFLKNLPKVVFFVEKRSENMFQHELDTKNNSRTLFQLTRRIFWYFVTRGVRAVRFQFRGTVPRLISLTAGPHILRKVVFKRAVISCF